MGRLSGLKPEKVWEHFENICNIPHPSGHEEKVAEYVVNHAKKLGLEAKRDEVGNVLVIKPPKKGFENVPPIILQSHLDMVPVAREGYTHDFLKDPIQPKIEGEYVRANNTTLGGDNGIGVAIMLALMEEEGDWGKIEFLFTISEETGMDGAKGLKSDFLEGRRLINLDSEEWGEIYISCAGGGDSEIEMPIKREEGDPNNTILEIYIYGLKGGHSGCDIHLGRGNANQLMARMLKYVLENNVEFNIKGIKGGKKRNAIPDNCKAWISINKDKVNNFKEKIEAIFKDIKDEFSKTEPDIKYEIKENDEFKDLNPCDKESTLKTLNLLIGLPHGVLAMSQEVKDLVETSTNLGIVETEENSLKVALLSRSAIDSALEFTKQKIRAITELVNGKVNEPEGYPGWKPNMDSFVLKVAREVYKKLYNEEPKIKAIHAGLECGIFAAKLPGVDMISIGPDVHNPHTPDEEVGIPSVEKTYTFLKEILNTIFTKNPA